MPSPLEAAAGLANAGLFHVNDLFTGVGEGLGGIAGGIGSLIALGARGAANLIADPAGSVAWAAHAGSTAVGAFLADPAGQLTALGLGLTAAGAAYYLNLRSAAENGRPMYALGRGLTDGAAIFGAAPLKGASTAGKLGEVAVASKFVRAPEFVYAAVKREGVLFKVQEGLAGSKGIAHTFEHQAQFEKALGRPVSKVDVASLITRTVKRGDIAYRGPDDLGRPSTVFSYTVSGAKGPVTIKAGTNHVTGELITAYPSTKVVARAPVTARPAPAVAKSASAPAPRGGGKR